MCFMFLSAAEAALHRHIKHTPINAPINKPIIKPIIIISPIYNYILLRQATAMQNTTVACCLISIVLDNSEFQVILLSLFILDTLRQGTHQTALHIAPLEFHHREDFPQPPSLVATVLSRSTFDLTEVSLSPLPVITFIEFAFQCLSPEDL